MFDVYNLLDIEPVKAEKAYFWDRDGNKYLDFYGGHAVISIGHSHPHYVELVTGQLNRIGFYSNAVKNHLQEELEWKLRELSGCTDYNLFLCNSGAEANENAHHVEAALKYGMNMVWIGARSTANPFAVQEIAESLKGVDIPVLVKNPVNPDIELWIGAFERLYLCGITKLGAIHRGFSSYNSTRYRNMPQWQIPIELKRRIKNLPLFCDPSHISGHREYIQEISQKAMDLGFDGLIIESHVNPDCALSDALQQITPDQLNQILAHLIIREEHPNNSNNTLIIEELREKIDTLDNTIMEVLTNRMKIIEEIGTYKKQNNITILQPDRWEKILTRVLEEARKNNLSEELVERVFKAIHQASIDRQTDIMNE